MSFDSPHKQFEFADWLERTQQGEIEMKVRELADKYMRDDQKSMVFGVQQRAAYVSPSSVFPTATSQSFQRITIDIDPAVHGTARRLIAESIIRDAMVDDDAETFI